VYCTVLHCTAFSCTVFCDVNLRNGHTHVSLCLQSYQSYVSLRGAMPSLHGYSTRPHYLHCTASHLTALRCPALNYSPLPFYATLYSFALYSITLYGSELFPAALLRYTVQLRTLQHYTVLYCTSPHSPTGAHSGMAWSVHVQQLLPHAPVQNKAHGADWYGLQVSLLSVKSCTLVLAAV
jgi:hypothetical protein